MTDRDRHFRTEDLQTDLIGRSVRGGTATIFAHAIRFALNVGSTVVLARMLAPSDFGLITMVAAATGFLTILRDFGLSTATVQSREIDQSQVSTLFWVNVMTGALLALVIALASPAIAAFFHEPLLTKIGIAYGLVAFIESLGVQHEGLLRRRMRFGALSVADVGSLAAGVAAGVLMARAGFGYWALVGMRAVTEFVRAGWLWAVCDWRPRGAVRFSGVRSQLAFGGFLTLSRFVRFTARHVDRLLVGRIFGPEPLGLYNRARGWLFTPAHVVSGPMSRVAVPVLSRLTDEPERFRAWFRTGLGILATIALPTAAYLFADTRDIVLLILGDQWTAAIPIFRILAPVSIAAVARVGFEWCYVSLGRTDRQFRWEIVEMVVTVAAFVIAIRWGVNGMAATWSAISIALSIPGALYCFRGTPVNFADLAAGIASPLVASIVAAGVVHRVVLAEVVDGTVLRVAVHATLFVAVYAIVWLVLPGGRARASQYVRIALRMRRRRVDP